MRLAQGPLHSNLVSFVFWEVCYNENLQDRPSRRPSRQRSNQSEESDVSSASVWISAYRLDCFPDSPSSAGPSSAPDGALWQGTASLFVSFVPDQV